MDRALMSDFLTSESGETSPRRKWVCLCLPQCLKNIEKQQTSHRISGPTSSKFTSSIGAKINPGRAASWTLRELLRWRQRCEAMSRYFNYLQLSSWQLSMDILLQKGLTFLKHLETSWNLTFWDGGTWGDAMASAIPSPGQHRSTLSPGVPSQHGCLSFRGWAMDVTGLGIAYHGNPLLSMGSVVPDWVDPSSLHRFVACDLQRILWHLAASSHVYHKPIFTVKLSI